MRVRLQFPNPSLTQQSFKDEVDINKIMKRFSRQTKSDWLSQYRDCIGGDFGDFSDVVDYRTALDRVIAAKASFEALPAVLRKRFQNDPAEFLDYCMNPANLDEMVSLGLATKGEPDQNAPSQSKPLAQGAQAPAHLPS